MEFQIIIAQQFLTETQELTRMSVIYDNNNI